MAKLVVDMRAEIVLSRCDGMVVAMIEYTGSETSHTAPTTPNCLKNLATPGPSSFIADRRTHHTNQISSTIRTATSTRAESLSYVWYVAAGSRFESSNTKSTT